jgi:phytoene desaturase
VVLERIFGEAGRSLRDELDLVRLDPQWRCFFEDGAVLDLHEDVGRMGEEIRRVGAPHSDADGYESFVRLSERLHDISDRFFFWKSVEDLRDTMDVAGSFNVSTMRDLLTLRMGHTVADTIRTHVMDARVAQMLDHFTQYVGSSPYGSPAVLCGIAHMQLQGGIWYPRGGTRAVPVALEKLARELGVEIRTGADVARIETVDGAVAAIELVDGERVPVAAAISNMDAVRTYTELLGHPHGEALEERFEPACSGVVLYLGLKERYEHLLHHNFVFSHDPEEEFDWIYGRGEPAPDPTCYLAAPSLSEPEVAPDGGEALYVLVHAPYLRPGHDWREMFPGYRETILTKLEHCGGMPDLRDRIVTEAALTPQDIHDRYRVLDGAIYGLASHGRFLGAFKPGNRSRQVPGLYLAGGAAHPGPGMPMVLMSGWIAADALDRDRAADGERSVA